MARSDLVEPDITMRRDATFNAADLTRAWLSVGLAAGDDPAVPSLDHTTLIEFFEQGVRLVACDSFILLTCFVHYFADPRSDLRPLTEPAFEEAPLDAVIARDTDGRGAGLMKHLLGVARTAAKNSIEPIQVHMRVGAAVADEGQALALAGLQKRAVVLSYPGHEEVALEIFEGEYPAAWRALLLGHAPKRISSIDLNPELLARISKLGKYSTDEMPRLACQFSGSESAVRLRMGKVLGALMPMRTVPMRATTEKDEN